MEHCKLCATRYQSQMKLSKECDSLRIDATLYTQLVHSQIDLTHSHPSISFLVSVASTLMQNPKESHLKVAKRIICYIKGTFQVGIKYCSKNVN